MRLAWQNWTRSPVYVGVGGVLEFGGFTLGDIHLAAMNTLFMDPDGNPGLLYSGASIFVQSSIVVAENSYTRFGFDEDQQRAMLRDGGFRYRERHVFYFEPPLTFDHRLNDDRNRMAEAPSPGTTINLCSLNVVDFARVNGFGDDAQGADRLMWWLGAVILHEIMHNHGFHHPQQVDYKPGTDYASSLPHVAFLSVLRASRHPYFFKNLIDRRAQESGLPSFGLLPECTPEPDTFQAAHRLLAAGEKLPKEEARE